MPIARSPGIARRWWGLAGLAVLALLLAAPAGAAAAAPTATPTATDIDGLVGDWSVTYGSPATVTIIFGSGAYSVISKTPVQVTGATCSLSVGTLIATFTRTGSGRYLGQHGLWWTNSCAFDRWGAMTGVLSADGSTMTATVAGLRGTTVFTRVPAPAAAPAGPEAVVGLWQAGIFSISYAGGTYSVTNMVERRVTGTACRIAPGTVTETFSGSGGLYFGQEVGWNPADCSTFETPATFTLHGDTLNLAILRSGATEVWHRAASAGATPATFRDSVPTPGALNLSPAVVVETLALAAGVIILVPFPGTLFNSTLRANYDAVVGPLRRARRRVRRRWDAVRQRFGRGAQAAGQAAAGTGPVDAAAVEADIEPEAGAAPGETSGEERRDVWWTPLGVGFFVVLTALLAGFLDPTFGLNEPSMATFVGMLVGLVVVLAAFDLPFAIYCRRTSIGFWVRALPATATVSIACVLISRVTDFHPGYLYGLVIAIVAAAKFDIRTEGRLMAAGTLLTLAAAVVAWLVLGLVSPLASNAIDPGPVVIALQTLLSMVVVAGVQVAAFGMLPLSFLPGESVRSWSRPAWAALLAFGWVAFGIVILNPVDGYLSDTTRTPLFTIVTLLVLFTLGSVLFWYHFHRHPTLEAVTGA